MIQYQIPSENDELPAVLVKSLALTRLTTVFSGAGPALQNIKAQTKIEYMEAAILAGLLGCPLRPHKRRVCGRSWQKVCHLHTHTKKRDHCPRNYNVGTQSSMGAVG